MQGCAALKFQAFKQPQFRSILPIFSDAATWTKSTCGGLLPEMQRYVDHSSRELDPIVFIAYESNRVAAAALVTTRVLKTKKRKLDARVYMLYIDFICSARVCKGAGTMLMNHIFDKAQAMGHIKYVTLSSLPSAMPFYNMLNGWKRGWPGDVFEPSNLNRMPGPPTENGSVLWPWKHAVTKGVRRQTEVAGFIHDSTVMPYYREVKEPGRAPRERRASRRASEIDEPANFNAISWGARRPRTVRRPLRKSQRLGARTPGIRSYVAVTN
jgi:hypothetical protein